MTPACPDPFMEDLVASYVLGACTEQEARELGEHLESCPACARTLSAFAPVREALRADLPAVAPGPELKLRVMRQVRADAELFAAVSNRTDEQPRADGFWARLRDRVGGPIPAGALAACAIALVIAGAVAGGFVFSGGSSSPASSRTVLGQVNTSIAPGATAQIVEHGGEAKLVVRGLPDPGRGRVYEVWLQQGKDLPRPTRALFSVASDGTGEASVPGTLKNIDNVLVTSEPQGGSRLPTRDPVITVAV